MIFTASGYVSFLESFGSFIFVFLQQVLWFQQIFFMVFAVSVGSVVFDMGESPWATV